MLSISYNIGGNNSIDWIAILKKKNIISKDKIVYIILPEYDSNITDLELFSIYCFCFVFFKYSQL